MPLSKSELQQQHDLLREEYIKLLNDKEVLLNWGKPQLEALYATRIGYLQVEKLQVQLRILALKRKIEIIQGAINRQEEVDISVVELDVATELADAEAQIMQEAAKLEDATFLLSHLDTPERSTELRKLYRQLAKQLHPDVNPDLTEEQKEIWLLVQAAYKAGDLDKLKALQVVYEKEIAAAGNTFLDYSEDDLEHRINILSAGIKSLNEEIATIRNAFPFTLEKEIKDDEWVAEQTALLRAELKALSDYEEELTQQYAELINPL